MKELSVRLIKRIPAPGDERAEEANCQGNDLRRIVSPRQSRRLPQGRGADLRHIYRAATADIVEKDGRSVQEGFAIHNQFALTLRRAMRGQNS